MDLKNMVILCSLLAQTLFTSTSFAAQFSVRGTDVCLDRSCNSRGAKFIGTAISGDKYGAISDGGSDAYDLYGYISGFGDLTATRQVETIGNENIFRWFDTYTNNTSSVIDTSVSFTGNLGSDDRSRTNLGNEYMLISSDSGAGNTPISDPAIAHIFGNNDFTRDSITLSITHHAIFKADINLSIDPGDSVSLLFYNFLARDTLDRSGDITLAKTRGNELLLTPLLDGLTNEQIARIQNFNLTPVPLPGAVWLLVSGLAGLIGFKARGVLQEAP